jgi:Xaa-Pro dipeptidase
MLKGDMKMPILPFTKQEFQTRVKKVKARMADQNLEALIISDPANLYYVSGYEALSYYVPQVVIVAQELDEPVAIIRLQDHYCATETCWMSDENIIPYPDKYLWEPKDMHVFDFVADFLKGKGLDKKRYGVEMDSFYLPAYWYQRLCGQLPDAAFVDSEKLVNWVRGPKSTQELEYMAIAARHSEKAMYDAVALMADGVRECDVAATICKSLVEGNGIFGGEFPSLPPIIPAGERTAGAHFSWTTEGKYQNGQIVYMEISGVYKRYHSPLTRTVFVGEPHQKIIDTSSAVIEGLNATMAFMKPGVTAEEVEKTWQDTINKLGFHKESRCGYTVGAAYPPVWCEDTIFCKPGEKSVLMPDMTFHMMPGLWLDGYGVAITETIRITENGCEAITKFPRKLLTTNDY